MTVTTHSPETNLFLSIPKSDKQRTPKARIVWEDVWSIYDACVSWRRWWQKQSNKLILLSAVFYPNRYILARYFFQNESGASCTLQKILERMWLEEKNAWIRYEHELCKVVFWQDIKIMWLSLQCALLFTFFKYSITGNKKVTPVAGRTQELLEFSGRRSIRILYLSKKQSIKIQVLFYLKLMKLTFLHQRANDYV